MTSKEIIRHEPDPSGEDYILEQARGYALILADFSCRMPAYRMEKLLHLADGTISGAIARKEIGWYQVGEQKRVTPLDTCKWLVEYRYREPDPLPG